MDFRRFIEHWKELIVPLFSGGALPWQHALTKFEIIPEYYQPEISIWTSVISTVGMLVVFSKLNERSREIRKTYIRISAALLVASILVLITLNTTVGIFWDPQGIMLAVVRIVWQAVFVLCGTSIATSITIAILLWDTEDPPPPPAISEEQKKK